MQQFRNWWHCSRWAHLVVFGGGAFVGSVLYAMKTGDVETAGVAMALVTFQQLGYQIGWSDSRRAEGRR